MEVSANVADGGRDESGVRTHEIDWDAYATQYDLLATNNPSYHENIELLRNWLRNANLPADATVCDVGAGTGNYICALAKELPNGRFRHLDADSRMNEVAARKYSSAGIRDVELKCSPVEEAIYPAGEFDLILCINALYAFEYRTDALRKFRTWLKPGGAFFVIDFGRRTKMWDWTKYILGEVIKKEGIVGCMKFLASSSESFKQNRRGSQGQADGLYWLHSTEEFGQALQDAGFAVEQLSTCYRGYCDLAICRNS